MTIIESVSFNPGGIVWSREYDFDENKYPDIELPKFSIWREPQPTLTDPEGVLYFKYEKK